MNSISNSNNKRKSMTCNLKKAMKWFKNNEYFSLKNYENKWILLDSFFCRQISTSLLQSMFYQRFDRSLWVVRVALNFRFSTKSLGAWEFCTILGVLRILSAPLDRNSWCRSWNLLLLSWFFKILFFVVFEYCCFPLLFII